MLDNFLFDVIRWMHFAQLCWTKQKTNQYLQFFYQERHSKHWVRILHDQKLRYTGLSIDHNAPRYIDPIICSRRVMNTDISARWSSCKFILKVESPLRTVRVT
jgi:hypothetical protein